MDLDNAQYIREKHGMANIGYWVPFDKPDSENTLIYLIQHGGREQASANWNAFLSDPDWRKAARDSQVDGQLLAKPPERIYLKALDFSPLK